MKRCLLAALLVLPLLGSDGSERYDGATESITVEGTWQRTEFEFDGRKIDLPYQSKMTLRGGAYTRKDSNGDTLRGSYRINPTVIRPILTGFRQTDLSRVKCSGSFTRSMGIRSGKRAFLACSMHNARKGSKAKALKSVPTSGSSNPLRNPECRRVRVRAAEHHRQR